jgi:hypothetical protein
MNEPVRFGVVPNVLLLKKVMQKYIFTLKTGSPAERFSLVVRMKLMMAASQHVSQTFAIVNCASGLINEVVLV